MGSEHNIIERFAPSKKVFLENVFKIVGEN